MLDRAGNILTFAIAAAIVSTVIYVYNFYGNTNSDMGIHAKLTLTPEPGKLHVLVTGGAGFIGSHASMLLAEDGHAVTVVDNLSRGNLGALQQLALMIPHGRFRYLRVDLGDKRTLCGVLAAASPRIDLVMHFAAIAYVGESVADPLLYYSNVTTNTVNLLECMQQHGIKQLVYSSTCAVYGNPSKLPVTEATAPKPINPYGQSKLMAEDVIRSFSKSAPDFKAIILRYFNVYGSDPRGRLGEYPRPELRHHARISGACMDAALGLVEALVVKGTQHPTPDGTCIRDYIHVMDLISAHMAAMQHLSNPPALYNIATGKGISVKQFVDACKNVTGRDIKVVLQAEARPGDYAAVWADPARINKDLGWKAQYTDVAEGLAHAWAWRSQHPSGYGP